MYIQWDNENVTNCETLKFIMLLYKQNLSLRTVQCTYTSGNLSAVNWKDMGILTDASSTADKINVAVVWRDRLQLCSDKSGQTLPAIFIEYQPCLVV